MKPCIAFEADASGTVVREVDDLADIEFGLRRIFMPGGEIIEETQYRFGRPHGRSRTWNSDGLLTSDAWYEEGELNGEYRSWWDNGHLKEQGNYVHGKRVDGYIWYTSDGSVWSIRDDGNSGSD